MCVFNHAEWQLIVRTPNILHLLPMGSWRTPSGSSWKLPCNSERANSWGTLLCSLFPALGSMLSAPQRAPQAQPGGCRDSPLSCGPGTQQRGNQEIGGLPICIDWPSPAASRREKSGRFTNRPCLKSRSNCKAMDLHLLNSSIDHGELSQELNTGFQGKVEVGGGWGKGHPH